MVIASAGVVAGITAGATLAAALVVALITAKTTNERQERQLGAEAERQAASLAHDRELADIADLRALLDQVASALDRATNAVSKAESTITVCARFKLDDDRKAEMLRDAKQKVDDVIPQSVDLGARLRVRLGPDDPISEALQSANSALAEMQSAVAMRSLGLGDDKDDPPTAKKLLAEYSAAYKRFVVEAVKRAGTVAPKPMDRNAALLKTLSYDVSSRG